MFEVLRIHSVRIGIHGTAWHETTLPSSILLSVLLTYQPTLTPRLALLIAHEAEQLLEQLFS